MVGAARGRVRYGVLGHLWPWGVGGLGTGPRRGPSRLSFPVRPSCISPVRTRSLSICCMYTRPTTTVCSSVTRPLLQPPSTYRTRTVFPSFFRSVRGLPSSSSGHTPVAPSAASFTLWPVFTVTPHFDLCGHALWWVRGRPSLCCVGARSLLSLSSLRKKTTLDCVREDSNLLREYTMG